MTENWVTVCKKSRNFFVNGGIYFVDILFHRHRRLVMTEKVIQGLPKSFRGKWLFSRKAPKGKKVIEFSGLFKDGLFQFRVIGFWNPIDKHYYHYHWYITNLAVPSKLIYPLYRLRWQCELIFKTAKNSLNLSDIPSSDSNIV